MTWGLGYGIGQGAGLPAPLEAPVSQLGQPPVVFDFSDEPDGPWAFPGWEFLVVQSDAGVVSGIAEPDPPTYFAIRDGYGWMRYDRSPLVGDPFDIRGYLAAVSPLVSDNVEVVVVFRSPTSVLDDTQAELFAELAVAVRGDDDLSDYVGGRARAEWSAGAWTTPLELQAIRAAGAAPVVLAQAPPQDLPRPTDTWDAGPAPGLAELKVVLRGSELTVELNGVIQTTATVSLRGPRKIGVFSRLERVDGSGNREVLPSIKSVAVRSLRDHDNLAPPVLLPGSKSLEAAPVGGNMLLPIAEWLTLGYVTRVGGRGFRVALDLQANVLGHDYRFDAGDALRAAEPYKGQEFTCCVIDLHAARTEGSKC